MVFATQKDPATYAFVWMDSKEKIVNQSVQILAQKCHVEIMEDVTDQNGQLWDTNAGAERNIVVIIVKNGDIPAI